MEKSEGTGQGVKETGKRNERRRYIVEIILVLFFTSIYLARPDWATALWYWPPWIWASCFFVFTLPSLAIRRFKFCLFALAMWMVFAFAFDNMVQGACRGIFSSPTPAKGEVSIVSFNCAGGSVEAAREAVDSGAQLIFLQESPARSSIEKLARAKWGGNGAAVWGLDGSILANGKLRELSIPKMSSNFTWALWEANEKDRYVVVSLRLSPPNFRLDYWNPDCWRSYAEDRKRRKAELESILSWVTSKAPAVPFIIGGDFNGPPTEDFQESLGAICRDSYAVGGRGWGGTGTNESPFVRFDQIWIDRSIDDLSASVEKWTNSDHRMARASFPYVPLYLR